MSTVTPTSSSTSTSTSSTLAGSGTTAADTSDRFLKLLVAQMKNQDPLNPMDNAQVTSQMAQINTVNGIEKLNTTVTNMSSAFTQTQMLQGASLVGRSVVLASNNLTVENGSATAGYELSSAASAVKVDVLSASGSVVDTMTFNNQDAGQHSFTWKPPTGVATDGVTFKVSAVAAGKTVKSTALNIDKVDAVTTSGGSFQLELHNLGPTKLTDIMTIS